MKKRILSLALVVAMAASLVACGDSAPTAPTGTEAGGTQAGEVVAGTDVVGTRSAEDYETVSEELYMAALGDFYDAYNVAAEATNRSERYALMAIAEAKLLESGCILPNKSNGGAYALRRIAPNSVATVNWGGDEYRFEKLLVTTDMVKAEDWTAMRALYGELVGTGTFREAELAYLAEHGYELADTYNYVYSSDPQTWDVFAEWNQTLYEPLCNTFDRLMQYDCENVLQPSLATSYDVTENADGTVTYTFHLRDGVKWVDSQGREVADVVADDFVAGAQHLFDAGSGIEALLGADGCSVVNADAYLYGEIADFSEVGIKAVDDKTVEYTLEGPCTFFESMLTYTTFAPLCRSYYKSQGGTFSAEGDEYTSGDYGIDQDHIVYCGPYLVTRADQENAITFEQNPTYWDAANMTVKTINWVYDDGSNPQATYDNFKNGVLTNTGLNSAMVEICKADGDIFDTYVTISSTDATCFLVSYNMNRSAFANYNDPSALVSPKTQEEVDTAYAALNNHSFRMALSYSLDRVAQNEQLRGADLAAVNLTNSYTLGTFVTLEEDTTVDINGTATTFPAGTNYGEIIQAQITADGYPMMVWNPEANDGLGGTTGFDGWYNPEAAAAEYAKAVEELAAEGVEISAENPVVLDYPVSGWSEIWVNVANVYKQSVEAASNGLVRVNLIATEDSTAYYYAGYYAYNGYDMNFDISDMTGWSADYGDPCSYLQTYMPYYAGYYTMQLGLY